MAAPTGSWDDYRAWLKTRPEPIQRLAAEFDIGSQFNFADGVMWLLGYSGGDMLIMVGVDPMADYDVAVSAERVYMHADCLRKSILRQ